MTPEKMLEEMYPFIKQSRFFPSKNLWQWIILFACGVFIMIIIIGTAITAFGEEINPPSNLWKGLIAEDTSGDSQVYLAIASCVRNRLEKGMDHGLTALKRKDLDKFVNKETKYALKHKNINLERIADECIAKAFENLYLDDCEVKRIWDFANGATHYEHTRIYGMPYWTKGMQVVKVLYPNTKKEITFYKELI